jgi:diadenosine tetraphosphate (Ap4A) HIT family hydrolase
MERACLICERIEQIKQLNNPYFVKELETGYVVIGDHQFYKGYTLFLFKHHVEELHELDYETRIKFLREMSSIGEAVYKAFSPVKLNYELLGNAHPHIHWHIFPRYKDDLNITNPVWVVDKNIRNAEATKPNQEELKNLKAMLLQYL